MMLIVSVLNVYLLILLLFIYVVLGVVYTDVQKSMKYAGLVYYEAKGIEDLVTFTAAKKLNALIQVRMYSYTHNVFIII